MTKEELLKLAIDAGVMPVNRAHQNLEPIWWSVTAEDLGKFAGLVTAEEREACAKVCERLMEETDWNAENGRYNDCVVAIRARSNAALTRRP